MMRSQGEVSKLVSKMTNLANSSFTVTLSEKPVFLFASGQRCGSTLLQRLLNSCPDILIWGEHNGYLNSFVREFQNLIDWEKRHSASRKIYLLDGYDNFLPNMVPEEYELREAATAHILALFGLPAAKLGKPVWGFKEVRYGAMIALFLQRLFPKAKFIHLTRNVVDTFLSMKRWEESPNTWNRKWTEASLADWARINESFLNMKKRINHLHQIKYESMVADPGRFTRELADFIEIPIQCFDPGIFNNHLDGVEVSPGMERPKKFSLTNLTSEEQALLQQEKILHVTKEYGYELIF